ncbi:MAG: carboxypeptidase-like regulatory domain-containing protein [Candidatus Altiarchaeota archaeon]
MARFTLCVAAIFFLASSACADYRIDYSTGRTSMGAEGWNHKSDTFTFTCHGAADLVNTPCYEKGKPVTREMTVSGNYVVIYFGERYETPGYEMGPEDLCWVKYIRDGEKRAIWFEGPIKEKAGVQEGYGFDSEIMKGPVTIQYTCRPYGYGSYVYSVRPTNCWVDIYYKAYNTCNDFCTAIRDNAYGKEEEGVCNCYCNPEFRRAYDYLVVGERKYRQEVCAPIETTTTTIKTTTTTLKKATTTSTTLRDRRATTTTIQGYRTVRGQVHDAYGIPLPKVKVGLFWPDDGKEKITYTNDDGYYSIKGGPTFGVNPENNEKATITVYLISEGDGIQILDSKSHNTMVYIKTEFPLNSEEDLMQNIGFPLTEFDWITYSTRKEYLHDAAVIYHETMSAVKFYEETLGESVGYQTPEEIRINNNQYCAACHVIRPITPIEDMGIYYDDDTTDYQCKDRHDNREWHEFSHHMMLDAYNDFPDGGGNNHGGFANPDTIDSFQEGFAEAMAIIISAEKKEPSPRLYGTHFGDIDVERNYMDDEWEEISVAGLIWDLYDPRSFGDEDMVDMSLKQVWDVIGTYTLNVTHLYNKLDSLDNDDLSEDEDGDGISDLDEIFIAHGFYLDENRNGVYDINETVGRGDIDREWRQ